jgi:hypothetical protein
MLMIVLLHSFFFAIINITMITNFTTMDVAQQWAWLVEQHF